MAHGHSVDLLALMFEGLETEFDYGIRDRSMDYASLLDDQEADILTSLLITPHRQERMLFSDPISRVGYPAIIMRSQDPPLIPTCRS